jgi:hypothetical protein
MWLLPLTSACQSTAPLQHPLPSAPGDEVLTTRAACIWSGAQTWGLPCCHTAVTMLPLLAPQCCHVLAPQCCHGPHPVPSAAPAAGSAQLMWCCAPCSEPGTWWSLATGCTSYTVSTARRWRCMHACMPGSQRQAWVQLELMMHMCMSPDATRGVGVGGLGWCWCWCWIGVGVGVGVGSGGLGWVGVGWGWGWGGWVGGGGTQGTWQGMRCNNSKRPTASCMLETSMTMSSMCTAGCMVPQAATAQLSTEMQQQGVTGDSRPLALTSMNSPLRPMKWISVKSAPKLAGRWRSTLCTLLNLAALCGRACAVRTF